MTSGLFWLLPLTFLISPAAEPPLSATGVELPNSTQRVLAVFDVDGTLLVSAGREVLHDGDDCAAVHPLMEPSVERLLKVSPRRLTRAYNFSGEEDRNQDPYRLLDRACAIEPVIAQLHWHQEQGHHVAILSARGHDPSWLAEQLQRKLALKHRIDPSDIVCVYSAAFEATLPSDPAGWSTPARKAHALSAMLTAAPTDLIHYFDDVPANLKAVEAHVHAKFAHLPITLHHVPFEQSEAACAKIGTDIRDHLFFGCRSDAAPSAFARWLLRENPVARQRLGNYVPQRAAADDDLPP